MYMHGVINIWKVYLLRLTSLSFLYKKQIKKHLCEKPCHPKDDVKNVMMVQQMGIDDMFGRAFVEVPCNYNGLETLIL